jgi:hypothetical protein
MLNLNSVMIGTKQPTALAAFYEKVLGKPADMVDRDNGFWGWQVGSAFISVLVLLCQFGQSHLQRQARHAETCVFPAFSGCQFMTTYFKAPRNGKVTK